MADALISPEIGATLWVATGATVAYCSRRITLEHDSRQVAIMGVLGAFIFAAQMINFSIPGTGSSGHLGGGMILAILLGPYAAFLTMASVLTVQALFFADGGLLALGCNIINLAFFPSFIAYPFIYRPLVGKSSGEKRILIGAIGGAVFGLQLGSLGVVLETVLSGVTELPFTTFLVVMQPIHLVIGIIEGCVTAAVVLFIRKARPEIIDLAENSQYLTGATMKKTALIFLLITVFTGTILTWFASAKPDGLEWAVARITGEEMITGRESGVHAQAAEAQKALSLMPGYELKGVQGHANSSLAGLTGGALSLILTVIIGTVLKRRRTAP